MAARPPAFPFPWPPAAMPRAGLAASPAAAGTHPAYLTALILLALSYQLGLCFVHTSFGLGGKNLVVAVEVALLLACMPLLVRRLPLGLCLVVTLLLANSVALALVRQSFDPKPLRDLMVPLVFLGVGMNASSEATADRLLQRGIWLVLAFALFEFFFVDLFTRFFDVYSYYLARGVGDPSMGLYRLDKLVASGIRPEAIGRTILPVLGSHRASSVFIEPVSFGNFAVICAAWGLAKGRERWRAGVFFVAAAAAMLVLADSRFGLVAIGLLVLLRLALMRGAEPVGIVFPFVAAGVVVLIASGAAEHSDSFLGRLTLTGRTLMSMSGREILGWVTPAHGYFDMGYPYVLANFGLLACLLLWAAFWLLPLAEGTGRRVQLYVALYLALILCVSGTSVFAFKTSAVLGFLLGSLAASRAAAGGTDG
jgi:putative polymerase